jgi:hypothetical protein
MPYSSGPGGGEEGVIPHPLPEVNFIMVEIPTPKPYIFMICSWNIQYNDIVYDTDVLYKNRESISDATAELQVKIIWSCFINK